MGKVILFGEPMALFIADTVGPLEEVEHFTRSLSGAEINVCLGLSRLGHSAVFVSKLGDDVFGHYIEKYLKKRMIDTEISYDGNYRTGIQLKSKVLHGDPEAPYYRKNSAASYISEEEINRVNLDDVDHLHITGIPPALSRSCRAATFRLVDRARERGIFVSFDPNLRPSLWEREEVMIGTLNELAKKADLVLPGVSEGKILLGTDQLSEIADRYQNMGVSQVIIKNGANGAYGRDGNKSYEVPGFKVENVVDTVGAGDGFAVGVISARLENLSFEEMMRRGNAIGAIQVMHKGDNEGLPTRDKLEEFMNIAHE